ncbi:hypothetical protein G6F56_003643 [Rhizopus delemar]|uniref:Uncharacterized protein n=1 Tax=Rhizopus stolonifer TaxID=4846 RepID=A0A367IJ09_RHIST|nr:hypothetical protein G6F56_003643 [Rhizopus delemar]RCH77648.1 hypothetical protein CU098_003568 [Rhizopus stolonifer]
MLSDKEHKDVNREEELYFLGQHHNTTFEIANRVFYATVDKFTKQLYPDTKRRSAPYSFRECWHLHSIYSKSQQTLLGIYPVKPSVLLSGDDILFTHEFSPRTQEDYDEQDWNVEDYANMTIGGLAVGAEEEDYSRPYSDQKDFDSLGSTHLFRVSSHQPLDENDDYYDDYQEEDYLHTQPVFSSSSSSSSSNSSSSSSSNNSSGSNNLGNTHPSDLYLPIEPQPLPRSSSLVSSNTFVSAKSNFSYQSLSDIIQECDAAKYSSSSLSNYGSAVTHFYNDDEDRSGVFSRFLVFVSYFWNMLLAVLFNSRSDDQTTPLLP